MPHSPQGEINHSAHHADHIPLLSDLGAQRQPNQGLIPVGPEAVDRASRLYSVGCKHRSSITSARGAEHILRCMIPELSIASKLKPPRPRQERE